MVVAVGVNDTPLLIPPDHEYVLAPVAVSVTGVPAQTAEVAGLEVTDNTGKGATDI